LHLLNAIIRGVTGYLLLRHPDAGAEAATILLASLFVVGGIFRMVAAGLFPRWGWTVFVGAVAVILGFTLLRNWPTSSTFFVGLAIGIDLILDGSCCARIQIPIQRSMRLRLCCSYGIQ